MTKSDLRKKYSQDVLENISAQQRFAYNLFQNKQEVEELVWEMVVKALKLKSTSVSQSFY